MFEFAGLPGPREVVEAKAVLEPQAMWAELAWVVERYPGANSHDQDPRWRRTASAEEGRRCGGVLVLWLPAPGVPTLRRR